MRRRRFRAPQRENTERGDTLTRVLRARNDLSDAPARCCYIIAHARTHYIYVLGADTRKTRVKCIKKATVRRLPGELPWRCQHQGGHIVLRRGPCCHLAGGLGRRLSARAKSSGGILTGSRARRDTLRTDRRYRVRTVASSKPSCIRRFLQL